MAEYVKRLLGANERILFETRKHALVLVGNMLKEILILIGLGIGFFGVRQLPAAQSGLQAALGVIALLVILSLLADYFRWANDLFIVTDRRVIHSSGIFSKDVLDSSLSKINDVVLRQSWLGRILGYGTIEILTASEEAINLLDRISNPIGFKKAMLEAKASLETTPGPATPTPTRSVTLLLEELAQLRKREMISEAEYQQKREEILKRM